MIAKNYQAEFIKCLNDVEYGKRSYDVFQDFLTVSAISLTNVVLKDKKLEKQYFEIISQYKKPERFVELLSITVQALEEKTQDFLGSVYMLGNFGNKNSGQFFTPYHISQFMSECTFDKQYVEHVIQEQGYVKMSEPCCGAGSMILAFAETLLKYNINPQKQMVFQGVDVDVNCCRMTFIQTSLLGLTGEVIHGNSISLEAWQNFITPMTILNWSNYQDFKRSDKKVQNPVFVSVKQDYTQLKLI